MSPTRRRERLSGRTPSLWTEGSRRVDSILDRRGESLLLVSLGGCFTSHFLAAIRAREAAVTNIRVAVTGTLAGTPERFTGFTMDVSAQCPDPELARKLITMAGRACQVVNTLRQVAPIAITYEGSPIELNEAAAVS